MRSQSPNPYTNCKVPSMPTLSQEASPTVIILEQCRISPSPHPSPCPDRLPLTHFDRVFLRVGPVKWVFFYELPCSSAQFQSENLGPLKESLSRALAEFRPLAGTLHLASPEILCKEDDAVTLVVAESSDNFSDLCANHVRSCSRFKPLVPALEPESGLVTLQVTIFPGAGVAIGVGMSHAVADGATTAHFLKTWAAFCRRDIRSGPGPSYDRSLPLADLTGYGNVIVQRMEQVFGGAPPEVQDGKLPVRATFSFSRKQIKQLKEEFSRKTGLSECSSFSLVYGVVLSCLVKATGVSGDDTATFGFASNARARLSPPLPPEYFGNCLGFSVGLAACRELAGEDGWIMAAKELLTMVQRVNSKGPEEMTEESSGKMLTWTRKPAVFLTVAGSPRLGMYEVDFGWGRPRKVEVVSIESAGAMSIAEWGEDGRGIEIGMALSEDLMRVFSTNVEKLIL